MVRENKWKSADSNTSWYMQQLKCSWKIKHFHAHPYTQTHLNGKAPQTNYINLQRQRELHFNATPNVARQALCKKTTAHIQIFMHLSKSVCVCVCRKITCRRFLKWFNICRRICFCLRSNCIVFATVF